MEFTTKQLIGRVSREFICPRIKTILVAVVFMILYAASNAAQTFGLKYIIDDTDAENITKAFVPLLVVLVFAVSGITNFFSNVIMGYVGNGIVSDMQKKLFKKLLEADLELHYKTSSGDLISRITNDISMIRNAVSLLIINVFKQTFTFAAQVGVMFYMDWKLSLIASSVLILIIIPVNRVAKRLKKLAKESQAQAGVLVSILGEVFKGIRVIKAYQGEKAETAHVNSLITQIQENRNKSVRVSNLNTPIMNILAGLAISAVLWYAGSRIQSGAMSVGDLGSFLAALIMASRPLKTMGGMNNSLALGLVSAERFYKMIDKNPNIVDVQNATDLKINNAEIKFENINFSYNDERTALNNLSITIPAGKKVALVGPSGGGKSTIMNLILRFFDPQSGKVLIDGQDISQVTIASLRKSISIVNQDVFLFDDTVRSNISYGVEGASDEAIFAAANAAVADEFISKLPKGYETVVGESGVILSGGQKQRISIARAMLRNSPILLLDEATSALDNASEREFQKALDTLMEGRTTLIIAHRLSTIINADLIYVIDGGRVIDSGTHEELLGRSQLYKSLYNV
jgi:subfamily B ATP-binding cassette protein MsbA